MANIVYGDTMAFDALAYGEKHPGTLQYLHSQVAQLPQISQTLTDAGRAFMSNAQEIFDQYNSAEALRLARAAINKASSLFQSNTIRPMFVIAELQNAPLIMQRFIMAEPLTRQLFHEQRIDGFSGTYVDLQPGAVGEDHYDYRRVMDGVLVDDDENDWKVTTYLDDLAEGDRDLTFDEKIDILSTWDWVRAYLKHGEDDPTSSSGGKL